jgi:hypothetical protein
VPSPARYQTPLEALVLANRLEQGDALVVGQVLRIPRVSGFPPRGYRGRDGFSTSRRASACLTRRLLPFHQIESTLAAV